MSIAMIDSLFASVDMEDYDYEARELLKELKIKKEEAKAVSDININEKVIIELFSMSFEILPNGMVSHAYILHNSEYEIRFAEFRSKNKNFYPIAIRIKSECLWAKGPEVAWLNLASWLYNISDFNSKITRIDLCYHTDKFKFQLNDLESFKGTYHDDNVRRHRRTINAIEFASRSSDKVYCRIYNKSLEIKKSRKLWFNEIWAENGLDIDNVWNIEFQIDRSFLKEKNIESVEDCFDRLQTIWNFCTKEWLQKTELDKSRVERSSITEDWIVVQNAFENYRSHSFITKEKQLEYDSEALVPYIAGSMTSYAARKGITENTILLEAINKSNKKYLSSKNVTLKDVIDKKRALLNGRRNNDE